MSKRNMENLEDALAAAEKAGLQRKLNLQMQMARKILEQLKRIEKLRHEIMNLDQKTIAEIKSYAKPPEAVHQVMAGCFLLLLGGSDKNLRVHTRAHARARTRADTRTHAHTNTHTNIYTYTYIYIYIYRGCVAQW